MTTQRTTDKTTSKAYVSRATRARVQKNTALKRKLMKEYGVTEGTHKGRRIFYIKDNLPPEIYRKITSL